MKDYDVMKEIWQDHHKDCSVSLMTLEWILQSYAYFKFGYVKLIFKLSRGVRNTVSGSKPLYREQPYNLSRR